MLGGPPLLAFGLMLYSHWVRGETFHQLGFGGRYFTRSLLLLTGPTLAAIALLLLVGYLAHSLQLPDRFRAKLTLLPLWAVVQQYFLLGFTYRRVRPLCEVRHAVVVAAALFSLVHAPNYQLMALTLMGGLVWAFVYERAPNLFAPAISHVLLSATVLVVIPPSVLPRMTVGYNYFLHHNF